MTQPLTGEEWKLVLLLAMINIVHILDFVIVMPLGDQLRQELSVSPWQFGVVVSVYGLSAMVAGIVASTVIDRFNRRDVLLCFFAGFILATLYCGLAPNYAHLVFGRILAGLCGGTVASTVMTFIVEVIPNQRRGRALGIVSSSFAFASTIGLPIGLGLAELFKNFGAPFLAIALLALAVWVASYYLLPSLEGHRSQTQISPWQQFIYVAKQPNHLWSFLFMVAMVLGTFMVIPFIAPYLVANCGLPRSYLSLMYGVGGIGTLAAVNLTGWMADRFGPRPIFLFTAGIAVVMTVVITNLGEVGVGVCILATTIFMMVASSRVVPAQAMMLQSADPKTRGAFTSLTSAFSHFATGTGPLISGLVVGEASPNGPLTGFWIAGCLAAFFGVSAMILSFYLRPAHQE